MSIVNGKSLEINSQYYTPEQECLRLFWAMEQTWGDLNGMRVLEPAVGSGAFIRAAQAKTLGLSWVTNELFPDSNSFDADFNENFLTLQPEDTGEVELVVGNPPFSGFVMYDEIKVPLGVAFVLHSLKFADRVAFVLPPSNLRLPTLEKLPKDVFVAAHTFPTSHPYNLGGSGQGEEKEVRTCIALFERRPGQTNDYTMLTQDIDGCEFLSHDEAEEATHFIQHWGGTMTRAADKTWGRRVEFARELPLKITNNDVEALLASNVINDQMKIYTSAAPFATSREIKHLINWALLNRG